MTGINEKIGGMVLIMPIEKLIHSGGFERTNEKEMMDHIIEKLYDEMNRREGTPPCYIFVDVEFEIISKNKNGEEYIATIKPDAIIVGEKSLIIIELKYLYGNVRIECSKNKGTANGKQAGEVKCNEFFWKNADTEEEIMYKNGRAVEPIKQIKKYRGKLWNLIKEYFGEEKVDDSSIGQFVAAYVVLPDLVQIDKDDNVRKLMERHSSWFKLLKLKDVSREILMQEVPHDNKVRKNIRKNLDDFVDFMLSHVSPEYRNDLVYLSGEEILGWYWPYKAKKEKKINESFPRIREILERKRAPEIYDAFRTIDLLGLYELYSDQYDAIIEDGGLGLKYREYALNLKRASMDMSNQGREYALYLLRTLDKVEDYKFFVRIIEELSKSIDEEWIESAVVLKKLSLLMIKYAQFRDKNKFIVAATFLSDFDKVPTEAIDNVLKVYGNLSALICKYKNLCINEEPISEQNIDDFCNNCVYHPSSIENVMACKLYALLSIASPAPETALELLGKDADELSIIYDNIKTTVHVPTFRNNLNVLTKIFDRISHGVEDPKSYAIILNIVDRNLKWLMKIVENTDVKNDHKYIASENIRRVIDIISKIPTDNSVDILYNTWKWMESKGTKALFGYNINPLDIFEKMVTHKNQKAKKYVLEIIKELNDDNFDRYIYHIIPRYVGDKEIADLIYERIENNVDDTRLWDKLARMGVPSYLDSILDAIKNFISNNKRGISFILEGLLSYNDPDVILESLKVVLESVQDGSSTYIPDLPRDLRIDNGDYFWGFVSEHADENWFDVLFKHTISYIKNKHIEGVAIENMIDILMKIDSVKLKDELFEYILKCKNDVSLFSLLSFVVMYNEKLGITSEDFYKILHHFMTDPEFLSENNNVTSELVQIVQEKIDLETISKHQEEIINLIDNCVKFPSNNLYVLISELLKKIYAVSGDSFIYQLEKYKSFDEYLFLMPLLEHPTEKGLDALLNYLINHAETSEIVYKLGYFAGNCMRNNTLVGSRRFKPEEYKELFNDAVNLLSGFLAKREEDTPPFLNFPEQHAVNFLVYFWGEYGVNAIVDLLDTERHSDIKITNVETLLRYLRRVGLDKHYGELIKARVAKVILKNIERTRGDNICFLWQSIREIMDEPDDAMLG